MVEALDEFNDSSVDVIVGEVRVCRAICQYCVGDGFLHLRVHSHGRRRREAMERIVCVLCPPVGERLRFWHWWRQLDLVWVHGEGDPTPILLWVGED